MKLSDINLMSQLMQRQMRLDPPLTRDLIVERDLPVPMQDGIVLLAGRWAPRTGGDSLPVALIRSPYGRGVMFSGGMARPLAERGFQVILQSARGTFGSGGTFEPMRNERADGLATLDWVVKQPWFGDSIVLVGPSYLGYVQWAVADRLPTEDVMGENSWREFESWPPSGYPPQPFYLGADGTLVAEPPGDTAPDAYRYDPADPTPAVGGVRMVFRGGAGRVENAKLEARPDVLTYTTAPVDSDVEVAGEVSAQIWFQSSLPHADVFVRLCDVDPQGRSWNICDGLTSVSGADELAPVTVRLWPTAYRFKRGHRIRVQVSSGAFPRYGRNPGTGEPRATATRLLAATQSIYYDSEHPSSITLPVRSVQ